MQFVLTIVVCLLANNGARAADVAGSADHPLIPRYEGSEIVRHDAQEFTDYRLMVAEARPMVGSTRTSTRRFHSKAR